MSNNDDLNDNSDEINLTHASDDSFVKKQKPVPTSNQIESELVPVLQN